MSSKIGALLSALTKAGALLFGILLIGVGLKTVWDTLVSVNATLAVALITAPTTIVAATLTVMLGRYYERKRDIDAHFRAEKIKIYDEFLREVFKLFHTGGENNDGSLVQFLREWQRKVILWGGRDVLRTYVAWHENLKQGRPNAQTVYLMDDFFRALRSDIGQSTVGLPRGFLGAFLLRHGSLFLAEAAKNPSLTLEEMAKIERDRFGEGSAPKSAR